MEASNPTRSRNDAGVKEVGTVKPLRLLRLPEVMARVGLRRSCIYQRMNEGRFPKSRSLGPRCTVWVETEVDAWIEQVAAGSV